MQTDKEFEDFFRDQLNGLEETPPLNAWNKIEEEIKPRRTWYREMAAFALLFLISVGTYFGREDQPAPALPESGTVAQVTANHSEPKAVTKTIQTSPEKELERLTAKPAQKIAANQASVNGNMKTAVETATSELPAKGGKVRPQLHGALALVKKNQKPGTVANSPEEEKPLTSETSRQGITKETANVLALAPEKRYAAKVKKSANGNVTSETSQELTKAGEAGLPGVTKSAAQETQSGNAKVENGTVSGTKTAAEIALTQVNAAKTDSVALNVVPLPVADSSQTVAQNKTEKAIKEQSSKSAFMVTFTPGIIARRLIANPNDEMYLRFDNQASENPTDLGYDLSATFQHRISPKTTLDAGLAYTKLHSNVTYNISMSKVEVVPQSGNSAAVKVTTTNAQEEIRNEFTYGGLRLGLTQEFGSVAGYGIFASSGAGMNMLLQKSGQLRSEPVSGNGQATQSMLADKAFHNVNSHLYLHAGVKKAVLPGVEVVVAPAFTYYLNSTLRKQQGFELKPYTFGLNLGLRYEF